MTYNDVCTVKGQYYLIKYEYIPSEYILKRYYNGGNEEILTFFKNNKDEIFEKAKSTYILPLKEIAEDCTKIKYMNKKVANSEMLRIQGYIKTDYKPIRSYNCTKCNGWHLTSKSNEILEQYESLKL